MSLERLQEWKAHRRFLISMRRLAWEAARDRARRQHAHTKPGKCGDSCTLDDLHADAIEEADSRARVSARREPDYEAEMKLPPGKTCGDCRHVLRCLAFGYTSSEARTGCDFHPNRFVDAGFPNDGWRISALALISERFA